MQLHLPDPRHPVSTVSGRCTHALQVCDRITCIAHVQAGQLPGMLPTRYAKRQNKSNE